MGCTSLRKEGTAALAADAQRTDSILKLNTPDLPNTVDQLLGRIIQNADGTAVEFPDLYNGPVSSIPDDKDEKLILVGKLKEKGFEVTDWGRGNNPPLGPRIIHITLKKADCECEVNKYYYSTTVDTVYTVRESVVCKRK